MFRNGASRTLFRSLHAHAHAHARTHAAVPSQPALRTVNGRLQSQFTSQLCTLTRRPLAAASMKPLALQFARGAAASNKDPVDTVDTKHEKELAKHIIEADPEMVSLDSTVHPVFGEVGVKEQQEDQKIMSGVSADIQTIKDTFDLSEVPKPALYIGLAGVLPYVATSLSTVACAYEVHRAHEVGSGVLLDEKSAELLLHILEPLQVGYGATVRASEHADD